MAPARSFSAPPPRSPIRKELAERLVESPVTLVDDDGAPKGERHLVFYNPPLVDPALGLRRSSLLKPKPSPPAW